MSQPAPSSQGTAEPQSAGRPGQRAGTVAELSLLCTFKPGGADQLRGSLQQHRAEIPNAANQVGTLHDMRWLIFDDDKRLFFCTAYDGDWDAYINDFASTIPNALDEWFSTVEGYPGIRSPEIKDWIVQHQVTAAGWYCAYPDTTVKQVWKGQKVLQAFEALLDVASS